jgi:hypothetical protein
MNIRDVQLKAAVRQLPNKTIDDTTVLSLLAAVGDTVRKSQKTVLTELTGKTRSQQFELAKAGLGSTEQKDLVSLLDRAAAEGFTLSPLAKNFLEALVGRAPLDPGLPPLPVTADASGLRGTGLKANAQVTALNMSDIVDGRQHITEGQAVANTDAAGSFFAPHVTTGSATGLRPTDAGDWVRVGVTPAGATQTDWFSAQVAGADTTPPLVPNADRIDLVSQSPGVIAVSHNTPRPMAEPFARMRLTNLTTGATKDFQANDAGSFAPFTVAGAVNDRFEVAISDGVNNQAFADPRLKVALSVAGSGPTGNFDLPDPALTTKDAQRNYGKARFAGPLFVNGVDWTDPVQGAIGNCYEPSGTGSVAWADPESIVNRIKEVPVLDAAGQRMGTKYQVTFFDVDWNGTATKVVQEVDGDLWVRSSGSPLYGATLSSPRTQQQMELWYSIQEKARAQWQGGYEATGQGGIPGEVASQLLGRPYEFEYVSESPAAAERIYQLIRQGASQTAVGKKNWAMTAGTYGHDQEARYAGEGVYANHAYTVVGASEQNGIKYVELRNPWGQSEPSGNGANDGIFKLPLAKFVHLYQSLNYVDPNGAGPALGPPVPGRPLNEVAGKDAPSQPFMTTAQKGLAALTNAAQRGEVNKVTPEAIATWLMNNHAPIEVMSLESALQALKDVERLAAGLKNVKADLVLQTVDALRTQLQAAVKRESSAIARRSAQ